MNKKEMEVVKKMTAINDIRKILSQAIYNEPYITNAIQKIKAILIDLDTEIKHI